MNKTHPFELASSELHLLNLDLIKCLTLVASGMVAKSLVIEAFSTFNLENNLDHADLQCDAVHKINTQIKTQ
ncbi:hypothetical protein [Leptothoe spongobia]|uniref:Uncharacterized protein n=1 Tax=Leptothoe spongobia TAU-MAC 1115 TaxID=1967444 RepID=A0A947GH45_9CYAN|nr:hypothetical protein [Leptothoe spongobia]MBT9314458.1 hypothetical protein [Leptothoe spongobia TAU-MAC 1115]